MENKEYKHREAFCLMRYRSDDGTEEEIIWNSRDGVTPFVITLRSGKQATHVNWNADFCNPRYEPKPDERIFVDLTQERAIEYARKNLQRWEAEGMDMLGAPTAIQLAASYMDQSGAPDIIEVI